MWRRALLAAAAVSCTLPRHAHAHCTRRLTQIQDLICVLIMSGMQKEDLDVSMLGKLQRYNVHLDDINNEQIRQQCTSRNDNFRTGEQNETNESYVSTTEYKTTIITKDPTPSVSLNMDSVIKYLKAQKDSIRDLDDTNADKTTAVLEAMVTPVALHTDNQPKIDMELLRRYIQLETLNKSFYKQDHNLKTSNHHTTINFKTNKRNPDMADDKNLINKLLKDYLSKQQKILTTTKYTPHNNIDIQNIYKKIDEIIATDSNIDNTEDRMVEKIPHTDGPSHTKFDSSVKVMPQSQNRPYSTEKTIYDTFYKLLTEMNQLKNSSSRPFSAYDNDMYAKEKTQTDKLIKLFSLNNPDYNKESSTLKPKFEIESNQKVLTPNLVKEIAETVRKVIIKDLRNELADIYLKTTQTTTPVITTKMVTTTEISPTTTSKSRTLENDMSIMNKFMDLYEEIKSLKQATFLLKSKSKSTTFANDLKQAMKNPLTNTMLLPIDNRLQIPETKVSISAFGNYNTKPFFNYNPYLPRIETNQRSPITIQTNSAEIQPLAVRISKPESMIRQNIVVHPRHRNQGSDGHEFRIRGNGYSDSNAPIKNRNRTYKNSPLKVYEGYNSARYPLYTPQEPQRREDIIRFRMRDNGNSKLNTDYYEKINFQNGQNTMNVKEKPGIFNSRHVPRFHEKLERADATSDGVPAVSDSDMKEKQEQSVDFPSRHQLSLVDMKKGSSYDDTHFKNFLKTQQKVTDMLEKILTTRTKTNMPRSVETI